jgi:undecaprenyl-diphosphatase
VISFLVVAVAERGLYLLPIALAAIWFWPAADRLTRRRAVLAGLISALVAGLMILTLGSVVERARPFVALGFPPLFPHGTDSSFPSDHTLLSAALAGPLLVIRTRIGAWLTLWALLIGFARVAAGVHYPSDVLGSVFLAALPSAVGLLAYPVAVTRVAAVRWLVGDRGADQRDP